MCGETRDLSFIHSHHHHHHHHHHKQQLMIVLFSSLYTRTSFSIHTSQHTAHRVVSSRDSLRPWAVQELFQAGYRSPVSSSCRRYSRWYVEACNRSIGISSREWARWFLGSGSRRSWTLRRARRRCEAETRHTHTHTYIYIYKYIYIHRFSSQVSEK